LRSLPDQQRDNELLVAVFFLLDGVEPAVPRLDADPHEILINPDRLPEDENALGIEDVKDELPRHRPGLVGHDEEAAVLVGGEADEGWQAVRKINFGQDILELRGFELFAEFLFMGFGNRNRRVFLPDLADRPAVEIVDENVVAPVLMAGEDRLP
jgi:hypothetical protein